MTAADGLLSPRLNAKTFWRFAQFGILVLLLGLLFNPERIWPAALNGSFYLLSLGLAGPLFISIVTASGGKWADAFRIIPESMGAAILPGILTMAFVLFGAPILFEWTHESALAASPLLELKSSWLNLPSFILREGVVLIAMAWLGSRVVSTSRALDGSSRSLSAHKRACVFFLLVFAPGFSVVSFDWLMSLEGEWFSTMFAVYIFTGLLLTGLAVIAIVARVLQRRGLLGEAMTVDHWHDLGKLIFAFGFFWGYIWFCQYMLIWYANMPEETSWFEHRMGAGWFSLMMFNFVVNCGVPFVVLLSQPAKRNPAIVVRVALLLVFGRWLDLYLVVTPTFSSEPLLGLWEFGPPIAALGGFAAILTLTLRRRLVAKTPSTGLVT